MTFIKGVATFKGRHHTLETKKKISDAKKGKTQSSSPSWKGGKPKCEKCGKQLSNYGYKRCGKHQDRDYKNLSLKSWLAIKKQQDDKEPTSIEKKLYEELKSRGLLFEKQKLINGRFLVDAYIPSLNLIIEADGNYWHSLERVVKKDKAENAYLKKCGYKLLRLSEDEINNESFKEKIN